MRELSESPRHTYCHPGDDSPTNSGCIQSAAPRWVQDGRQEVCQYCSGHFVAALQPTGIYDPLITGFKAACLG